MLIIPPTTLREYNQKVKAFHTLFDIEPQVIITGTLIEFLSQDTVFLKNRSALVVDAKEIDEELYFLINENGEAIWVRKYQDDFDMIFI